MTKYHPVNFQIFVIAICGGLAGLFYSSVGSAASLDFSEEEQQWLTQHKMVVTGVDSDFAPPNLGVRFHQATVPRSISLLRWIKGRGREKRLLRLLIPSASVRKSLRERLRNADAELTAMTLALEEQRKRAEEELRRHRDHLEELVAERTAARAERVRAANRERERHRRIQTENYGRRRSRRGSAGRTPRPRPGRRRGVRSGNLGPRRRRDRCPESPRRGRIEAAGEQLYGGGGGDSDRAGARFGTGNATPRLPGTAGYGSSIQESLSQDSHVSGGGEQPCVPCDTGKASLPPSSHRQGHKESLSLS